VVNLKCESNKHAILFCDIYLNVPSEHASKIMVECQDLEKRCNKEMSKEEKDQQSLQAVFAFLTALTSSSGGS